MLKRLFEIELAKRGWVLLALVVITGALGALAGRVKPDYSIELFFPVWAEARQTYDRLRKSFPNESAQAIVVVESEAIFSKEGLARMEDLERKLEELPNVVQVKGLTSVDDVTGGEGEVRLERLVPREAAARSEEAIARVRKIATTDPLFASRLVRKDGNLAAIQVKLDPKAAELDEARQAFTVAATDLLAHEQSATWKLTLSGLPVIRAEYVQLTNAESPRIMPLALIAVLLLLFLTYRRIGVVLAGFATLMVSLIWSSGVLGALGYSMTLVTTVLPIVVMIVSLSDTVHIASDFVADQREGKTKHDALLETMVHSALPCLATEVVLACGFLSLIAINILAIVQFGITAAICMLTTWLANVTVLPLALSITRPIPGKDRARSPWLAGKFERLIELLVRWVDEKPRQVVLGSLLILGAGALCVLGVEKRSFVFDDLKPGSKLDREISYMESAYGGIVPVSIYVESLDSGTGGEAPILEPEVIDVLERAGAFLRTIPEVTQAISLADYVEKAHRLLATDGSKLPATREAVAQEVFFVDDGESLGDVLAQDRRSSVVLGYARDPGSKRTSEIFTDLDAWVTGAQAKLDSPGSSVRGRFKIHATGNLRIFKEVDDMLVGGLLGSFGGAVIVSILLFCVVLRSIKLGLIGLIPNVSPMVLVFAFMAIAGITLRPSTVIVFSIILVIADDDTIQYLARLRGHYAEAKARHKGDRSVDLHREAALDCLRRSGLPMLINSTAVSAGFLLLMLSSFRSTSDAGLLIGATLFAAVFADLLLTPIMVIKFKPRLEAHRPFASNTSGCEIAASAAEASRWKAS